MVIEGTTFGFASSEAFEDEDSGWKKVIGDREIADMVIMESGDIGDIAIGWMEFNDGTIEIGEGACMRPYFQQYIGTDRVKATKTWIGMIQHYFTEG